MIILKFGGTSVSSVQSIKTICQLVKQQDDTPVVVVSALSGVTDKLLRLTATKKTEQQVILKKIFTQHVYLLEKLFSKKSAREKHIIYIATQLAKIEELLQSTSNKDTAFVDNLISFGEIFSSYIITQVLLDEGFSAKQCLATDFIITNNKFGNADYLLTRTRRRIKKLLLPLIERNVVTVVTGFIGRTSDGRITTLGRGGSDYSAAIIGACLEVDEIQIWTDVDGVYTVDPNKYKHAKHIPFLTYAQAESMAKNGAKVLHPATMRPALEKNIPIHVRNTFNTHCSGTRIMQEKQTTDKDFSFQFTHAI